MGRDGSDRTQINDRGWCANWSPDGRSIAYIMSGTNLAVYDVTTGEERVLLQNEHADRFQDIRWGFCWSPDSKQLCFHGTSKTPSELVIVDVRGSSHGLQVFALSEFGNKVAWHPDGQQILYSALDKTRNTEQLHILDRRHPEQSRVVPGQPSKTRNNGPAWSPDGKQIVFCAYVTPFWSPR